MKPEDPCPVCGNRINALQRTRDIVFNSQAWILHYRCWYENQDVIRLLEEKYPELSLMEALRNLRDDKTQNP